MNDFELDPRLANDCLILGQSDLSLALLNKNALVPWLILVPRTRETEIIDLPVADQARVLEEINRLSRFIKTNFTITKLNIAAIGNIVSQLHIHVIGRDPADYCWPNVVWGTSERKAYTEQQIDEITRSFQQQLGDLFHPQK